MKIREESVAIVEILFPNIIYKQVYLLIYKTTVLRMTVAGIQRLELSLQS